MEKLRKKRTVLDVQNWDDMVRDKINELVERMDEHEKSGYHKKN